MSDPAGLMMMSSYNRERARRRLSSSSRSIKVFANYHHQLYKNNNNKKRTQQAAETISRKNIMIDKDDKQKKKMKMMMMNRCSSSRSHANAKGDDHISNNNNNNYYALDDDFVVHEILVRLPVKTLMRFKSACKSWMSSIQHDRQFHRLHFKHSETRLPLRCFTIPRLPDYRDVKGYQVSDANNLMKGVGYHTFQTWDILFSVHGLVCLVGLSGGYVRIYNPSTRQETQRIGCPIGRIVFGFDPVSGRHKVLCRSKRYPATYQVLTVGENSWRRIDHDQVPDDHLDQGQTVYLNGAVYWMEKIPCRKGEKKKEKRDSGAAEVLVAFDVGSEKFRVIPIPDYIVNQPRDESHWYGREYHGLFTKSHWYGPKYHGLFTDCLLEVNGRVALLRRKDKNTVSMWMLEYDADHDRNWTEVVISLPFEWGLQSTHVVFDNVPGTDRIIMKPGICDTIGTYSHNWKTNTSEKIDTISLLSSWIRLRSLNRDRSQNGIESSTHFRESLFPVN